MGIYAFILVVTSLQAGITFCHDNIEEIKTGSYADVLHRMEEVEKRETERENERRKWKQQIHDMMSKVSVVLNENSKLKCDLNNLKKKLTTTENEREELLEKLVNFKAPNHKNAGHAIKPHNELESNIHQILGGLNKPTERDTASHMKASHVRNARNAPEGQSFRGTESELGVAFYVSLSSHIHHVGINQTIAFNNIITNEGNAYNSHVGDFRAPVAGTYVFSTTLVAYGTQTTDHYIARNGVNVGNLHGSGQATPNSSTSLTIVLRLQAGDDVAVRNIGHDNSLHTYSSFSGFLLQEDFTVATGNIVG